MSKVWKIFSKDTPTTGTPKLVADKLEYHDIWMGEEYVLVTLTSPTPLNLEIGDYLIYRGRKYSIYNVSSALKQARENTYKEAFRYENVKFSSYGTELTEIRFLDIVLGDNELHYTSLPKFQAYCENVDDLVDRLQANTDREKNQYDSWFFITPDKQRTLQRIIKWDPTAGDDEQGAWVPDTERQAIAENIWNEFFQNDEPEVSKEKKNVNISVDTASVWDGLSYVKQHFGLNFITNCHSVGRVAVIGAGAKHTSHIFQYGKGNGLSQIERVADSDQLVVTKLFAYGSDKNLPYHHYSDLTTKPFLYVTGDYRPGSTEYAISVALEDVDNLYAFTNIVSQNANIYYCTFTCMIGNIVCDGNAELISSSLSANISVKLLLNARGHYSGNPNTKYTTQYNIDSIKATLDNARTSGTQVQVVFMSDADINKFQDNRRYMLVDGMPNNMAVNCLMLPGFPLYALNNVVKCEYIEVEDEHYVNETRFYVRNTPDNNWPSIPSFIIPGNHVFTFSTDRLRPWIKSPNSTELGIKEGDVHFVEESDDNGLQDVHPSIEGMTEDDVFHNGSDTRIDEIYSADVITDNGRFDETDTKPDFHVVIRDLGFDLKKAFTDAGSSMKLSLKDGYCGGRDFNVKTMVQLSDGKWRLTLERFYDESLELYFPYSDAAAHYETPVANEPYQIRTGDHFVLTDILIQDTNYVHAASVELLRKSCLWLASNDYTRFTYMPKIDEIFMARDNDTAYSSEYQTIKAGKMMDFADTDFLIDASIYIDQLTIKEGGNQNIPTYDVTLREDKQVGKLQRMQNQINSISNSDSGSAALRYIKSIWDFDSNGNLFTKYNVYSLLSVSALGMSPGGGGGGGGATTLDGLLDVMINSPQDGDVLKRQNGFWVNDGGYATQTWVQSQFMSNITPVINGVGLTNDGGIKFTGLNFAETIIDLSHQHRFEEIIDTPETIRDYGIKDAYINNGTIYLGENSITPLTSFIETDPTVPLWAKAANKPTYTLDEVLDGSTRKLSNYLPLAGGGTITGNGNVLVLENGNLLIQDGDITLNSGVVYAESGFETLEGYKVTGMSGFLKADGTVDNTRYLPLSAGISNTLSGNLYLGSNDIYGIRNAEVAQSIKIGKIYIAYEQQTNALKVYKMVNGVASAANFYTLGAVSALGLSDSGSGGSTTLSNLLDVHITSAANGQVLKYQNGFWVNADDAGGISVEDMWYALGSVDPTKNIDISHISAALATGGYATRQWALSQFLTNVTAVINGVSLTDGGGLKFSGLNFNDTIIDLTHQHRFEELLDLPTTLQDYGITDAKIDNGTIIIGLNSITPLTSVAFNDLTSHPTTLSGYGITDAKIENGTITLGSASITPITNVSLSMPTGFSVSYSGILNNNIAVTFTNGYEIFTTELKEKINALFSWFTVDSNGDIKTTNKPNNGGPRGFYSESFISALGLNSQGGGECSSTLYGLSDVEITDIQNGQVLKYDNSIGKWVNANDEGSNISWNNIVGKPNTLSGYGIIDAYISNGTIYLGNNSITPVTSLSGYATQTWVNNNYLSKAGGTITGSGNALILSDGNLIIDQGDLNVANGDIILNSGEVYAENGFETLEGYKVTGMTGFLKADGTVDSNTYLTSIALNSLTDVTITTPISNDSILSFTGTRWENVSKASFLNGYATQTWVGSNYLSTSTALISSVSLDEDGRIKFSGLNFTDTVIDLTHQHRFEELIDLPSTLIDYGIEDAYINNGTVYLGSESITPVTSVAMTVPTGFTINGSPISKTGTLALNYSQGYEGFMTSWKTSIEDKVNALYSWFEVDSNGDIKTKDKPNNGGHRGFYSESFISALGLSSSGGGGGSSTLVGLNDVKINLPQNGQVLKYDSLLHKWVNDSDAGGISISDMWNALADSSTTQQIALSHLTTALNSAMAGYATQSWVGSNYLPLTGGDVSGTVHFISGTYDGSISSGGQTGGLWIESYNGNNKYQITLDSSLVNFMGDIEAWSDIKLTESGNISLECNTSDNVTGAIFFKYANGNNKIKLWADNAYTSIKGLNYQVWKEDGTSLYSGTLATTDEVELSIMVALFGYATKQWVSQQGYATQTWVGNNYLSKTGGTMTGNLTVNANLNVGSNVGGADYLYSIVGDDMGLTFSNIGLTGFDDFYFNGDIYADNVYVNNAAVLTTHQSIYGLTVYGGSTAVLTYTPNTSAASLSIKAGGDISIGNDLTNKAITLSYSHPTNGANTTISAANGKVLSAITVNNLGHVTSVASKTLTEVDIPTISISKVSGLQTALDSKLDIVAFERLFNAVASDGTTKINHPYNGAVASIKAMFGLWTESYLSALGLNASGGGGGSTLSGLSDVSINSPQNGQLLKYDSSTSHWVNYTPDFATQSWVNSNYLPKTGGTITGYGNVLILENGNLLIQDGDIELDSGAVYAEIGFETLAGYKITGGTSSQFLKADGSVDGNTYLLNTTTYISSVSLNNDGRIVFSGNNFTQTIVDLTHQHRFEELIDIPTKIQDFGITDAYISNGTIYLGENSITPLTSKPTYTLDEIADGTTRKLANYLPLDGTTYTSGNLTLCWGDNVSYRTGIAFDNDSSDGAFIQIFVRNGFMNGTKIEYGKVTSPEFVGDLTGNASTATYATTAGFATDNTKVLKTGDTMTGVLKVLNTIRVGGELSGIEYLFAISADDNGMYFTNYNNQGADDFTFNGDIYADNFSVGSGTITGSGDALTLSAGNLVIYLGDISVSNGDIVLNSGEVYAENGFETLGGYKVSNGTSSQFLKADGSVDSNAYLLSSTAIINSLSLNDDGRVKFSGSNFTDTIIDLTHEHRWEDIKDRPNIEMWDGSSVYISGNLRVRNTAELYDLHIYDSNDHDLLELTEMGGQMAFLFNYPTDVYFSGGDTYNFDANVYGASFINNSDARLKNILQYGMEPTCEAVANAPAIKYTWNEQSKIRNRGAQLGSIAQYWQSVLPETVTRNRDGYLAMQYDVIALLSSIATAKRVMEHERRIEQLEHENALLKMEINDLKDAA